MRKRSLTAQILRALALMAAIGAGENWLRGQSVSAWPQAVAAIMQNLNSLSESQVPAPAEDRVVSAPSLAALDAPGRIEEPLGAHLPRQARSARSEVAAAPLLLESARGSLVSRADAASPPMPSRRSPLAPVPHFMVFERHYLPARVATVRSPAPECRRTTARGAYVQRNFV